MGMDLSSAKVTPEQKVSLCTKYFYLGFLCLPFLWGVNAAWFFGEAFRFAISEIKTFIYPENGKGRFIKLPHVMRTIVPQETRV